MLIHREVLTGILCSICSTQTNRGKPGERDTPAQQSLPLHAPTWRRHVPVLASLRAGAQSPLGTSREPQKSENGPIIVWTILARTRYLLSQLVSDPEPQEPLVASLAQTQGLTAPQVLVFLTKDIQVRRGQTCASRTHLDRPL